VVLTANSFPGGFGRWEFVALCSAVASAGAVTAMRAARRSEGVWTVYASMTFSGALITAPFAVNSWRTPSLSQASLLVTMSAFAFGGQALMMRSLRWVSAMTIGIIAQLAVVVSMLLGYVVLGEPMTPTLYVGAALVVVGLYLTNRPKS